jgi:hypothetical protein
MITDEPRVKVELLGIGDIVLAGPFAIPAIDYVGVVTVRLNDTPGVVKIKVNMEGSGAIDDIVFRLEGDRGSEGCTVGFWSSVVTPDPTAKTLGLTFWEDSGLRPGDSYNATFGSKLRPDMTLLDALQYTGNGGINNLCRESVAALLNAMQPHVNFRLTGLEVVSLVQHAYSGEQMMSTAALLRDFNDQPSGQEGYGCPLMDNYSREARRELPRRRLQRGRN